MDYILTFFIINFFGYIFWRVKNHLFGYSIQHLTILNFVITILFYFPLQIGGYLDIEENG